MEMNGEIHPKAKSLWYSLSRSLEVGGTELVWTLWRGGWLFQLLLRIGL